MRKFFEFFSGGGMARLGLGPDWKCAFANDVSAKKGRAYCMNFPDANEVFRLQDIRSVCADDLADEVDLVWGSFPCQDLSLAGFGQGLSGERSGLIWKLLSIVSELKDRGRRPPLLVFENVNGLLNSRNGDDLRDILRGIQSLGYVVGVVAVDAALFLPQSRQRLFIVAVDDSRSAKISQLSRRAVSGTTYRWTTQRLSAIWKESDAFTRRNWVWWNLPEPVVRKVGLAHLIERDATSWDAPDYTARLLSMMSATNLDKVNRARRIGKEVIGAAYRRTRVEGGKRVQRVEVRFDDMSGCLRTASGGSSRQRLIFVNGISVRSRLLTPREAARLMGVPESYRLPESYNDAYQLAGDGVAVPVVDWLSRELLVFLSEKSPVGTIVEPFVEGRLLYA